MSLYSRGFVRGLRRRTRIETKLHPHWKAEARSAGKLRARLNQRSFRWAVPLASIGLAVSEKGTALALPILMAWGTMLMFARAAEIQALFFGHAASTPFYQFPVGERFVFIQATRRLLRSSLWLAVDALVFLSAVVLHAGSFQWLGVVGGAAGIWAAALAGAIALVWLWPRFPFAMVSGPFMTFGLIGFWVGTSAKLLTPASILAAYESAKWWLPPGWVCALIEPWLRGDAALPIVPTALLAGGFVAASAGFRRLREGFAFWEPHAAAIAAAEASPDEPRPARVSRIEEAVLGRGFLAERAWSAGGFIERTGARLLTVRERRVMDLMLTLPPGWTRRYPYGCLLVLAAPVLAWLARGAFAQPALIFAVGSVVGLAVLTPLFGGKWSGFAMAVLGHRFASVLSMWPVGLREARNSGLKFNFARFLWALPWWLFAGGSAAGYLDVSVAAGVVLGGKCWLAALLLQPFFLVFCYSSGTNDTSSGCLFLIWFFALACAVLGAAVTTVVLSFTASGLGWWLAAAGTLAALSWAFEAAYRRAWRGQQFDLLAKSRPDQLG